MPQLKSVQIIFLFLCFVALGLVATRQSLAMQTGPSRSLDTLVIEAAKNGDEKDVERLLSEGAATDAVEAVTLRTALHYSAQRGQLGMVRLLLGRRANPNVKDRAGMTPLMTSAIGTGQFRDDIVRLLVEAKADLDARTPYGDTAIRLAAEKGFTKTVLLLIDAGARIDVQSALNLTLLKTAESGNLADVTLLIKRGANANVEPTVYNAAGALVFKSDTPLIRASANGHESVVRALLDAKANANLPGTGGKTPLIVAVTRGVQLTKLLLDRGADPNLADNFGKTPLMHVMTGSGSSSSNERRELILSLKQAGADLNAKDNNGDTAMRLAVANWHVELLPLLSGTTPSDNKKLFHNEALLLARRQRSSEIESLLSKGDDPNVTDKEGRSALSLAAIHGGPEMIHALLLAGCNIDHQDKNGLTPLMYSVRRRNLNATKLLLSAKPNTNIKNHSNETALIIALPTSNENAWARNSGNMAPLSLISELVAALLAAGANPNIAMTDGIVPLMIAAARSAHDIVISLIAHGADVNAKTQLGLTAYHVAVGEGLIKTLKTARTPVLPSASAKKSVARATNQLLIEAAWHGNTDLVEMLIVEEGADVNYKTSPPMDEQTALYYAVRSRNADTVKALLKLGANPNVSAPYYGSPLDVASQAMKPDAIGDAVIKALIDGGAKRTLTK